MRKRTSLALGTAVFLIAFLGFTAYAKKKNAEQAAISPPPIPKDQKIVQALNRLTFGPRPGDVQQVNAIGLKKWIDQQLHPETHRRESQARGETAVARFAAHVADGNGGELSAAPGRAADGCAAACLCPPIPISA